MNEYEFLRSRMIPMNYEKEMHYINELMQMNKPQCAAWRCRRVIANIRAISALSGVETDAADVFYAKLDEIGTSDEMIEDPNADALVKSYIEHLMGEIRQHVQYDGRSAITGLCRQAYRAIRRNGFGIEYYDELMSIVDKLDDTKKRTILEK